jgi:hypothetical protein
MQDFLAGFSRGGMPSTDNCRINDPLKFVDGAVATNDEMQNTPSFTWRSP